VLGAVQYDAPFSTGSGLHCWQESDVMCYADGGNEYPGSLEYDCGDREHFDCAHNDYFDAAIGLGQGGGPGSYLDTHWNLGGCYDRFIVNYACPGTVPPQIGYAATVLADAPAGYWRLGELSGTTAADSSGNGNAGSYLNGVSLGQPGAVAGDNAARFDGVDDTVQVASSGSLSPTGALTLEAWAKSSTPTWNTSGALLSKHAAYALYPLAGTRWLAFAVNVQGSVRLLFAQPQDITLGHHYVGTYDGQTLRLYLDGQLVDQQAASGPIATSTTPLYLAHDDQGGGGYGALTLDEVAVYSHALSAARVQAHLAAH
jgi:hypothetical protein